MELLENSRAERANGVASAPDDGFAPSADQTRRLVNVPRVSTNDSMTGSSGNSNNDWGCRSELMDNKKRHPVHTGWRLV